MARAVSPLVAALCAVALLLLAAPAAAHTTGGGAVRLEQTLGGRDLTLSLTVPDGPGAMPVLVDADADTPPTALRVAFVPRGAPVPADAATLTVGGLDPAARADLAVAAEGDGELLVDDGRETARVPLRVRSEPSTAADLLFTGGALVAVLALFVAVGLRERPRPALAVGAVALVALGVAVCAAVLAPPAGSAALVGGAAGAPTATTPSAAGPGAHGGPGGHAGHGSGAMPPASSSGHGGTPVALEARVVEDGPGGSASIEIATVDPTSGAPVDDLVVHDDAFVHLVVVGPGGAFAHQHPVRVGPGRWSVAAPVVPGRHALFAEVERESGGVSVLRGAVTVGGSATPGSAPAGPGAATGPGVREVDGVRADVRVTGPGGVVAGRPARVSATFATAGPAGDTPVVDLQPWLGMAGHLLVLGPDATGAAPADPGADVAAVERPYGHVHDMRPASTGGVYGPEVAFTTTFPRPGRYATWVQVRRADRVLTVPVTVDVAPAPSLP